MVLQAFLQQLMYCSMAHVRTSLALSAMQGWGAAVRTPPVHSQPDAAASWEHRATTTRARGRASPAYLYLGRMQSRRETCSAGYCCCLNCGLGRRSTSCSLCSSRHSCCTSVRPSCRYSQALGRAANLRQGQACDGRARQGAWRGTEALRCEALCIGLAATSHALWCSMVEGQADPCSLPSGASGPWLCTLAAQCIWPRRPSC